MAELSELALKWRLAFPAYPWRRVDPVPWAPLRAPLARAKVALVSTAGLVPPGQQPFDQFKRGGDPTFRTVPTDIDVQSLTDAHRSEAFDHAGIARDRNLAFPLDRLRELVDAGRIGALNHRHLSFMGSLSVTSPLVRHTAPQAASLLVADGVDAALLVPV